MQLQGGGIGSHNGKETKSSNRLWIDEWLDYHQNQKKCGIVGKNNAQTLNDKIMFIQSYYVVQTISTMSICRNQMQSMEIWLK
jgi:hypothetical protein